MFKGIQKTARLFPDIGYRSATPAGNGLYLYIINVVFPVVYRSMRKFYFVVTAGISMCVSCLPSDVARVYDKRDIVLSILKNRSLEKRGYTIVFYTHNKDGTQTEYVLNDSAISFPDHSNEVKQGDLTLNHGPAGDSQRKVILEVKEVLNCVRDYSINCFTTNHSMENELILYLNSGYIMLYIENLAHISSRFRIVALPSYRKIDDNWYYAQSVFY